MKLGNEVYTYAEMELMATYEELYKIPHEKMVTHWWGDMHMYEFKPDAKPEVAKETLEKALASVKMTRDELKEFHYVYRNSLIYKMKENMPKRYEAVIIFNKPMLFTNERLEYENIPNGLHRYDIRDGGMDGNMCELKDKVGVNHWGTVLSRDAVEPRIIDGKEKDTKEGIIMTDDDYNYTGEEFTTQEYLDNYTYLEAEYCESEETQGMTMQ